MAIRCCQNNNKMTAIQRFFFRRKQAEHPHTPCYVSWDKVERLLLLFDAGDTTLPQAVALVRSVQAKGKKVRAFYYAEKYPQYEVQTDDLTIICRKDTDLIRRPKSNPVKDAPEFDIVIDLTFRHCLPLHYIAVWAKSKMICGSQSEDKKLIDYDFEIALYGNDRKPEYLLQQTVRYLKMIKSE